MQRLVEQELQNQMRILTNAVVMLRSNTSINTL